MPSGRPTILLGPLGADLVQTGREDTGVEHVPELFVHVVVHHELEHPLSLHAPVDSRLTTGHDLVYQHVTYARTRALPNRRRVSPRESKPEQMSKFQPHPSAPY